MARTDHTADLIQKTLSIGLRNKEILSSVRNWCSHFDVTDISSGMVAEMKKVPIRFRLSCKHASGALEAMPLDSAAEQFIVENCLKCQYHNAKADENFGAKVLKAMEEREKAAREKKQFENQTRQALQDRINELVNETKKTAHQPALSILRLIDQLSIGPSPAKTAADLLEASQLQPTFFLPEALDSMALYFENPQWGGKVMLAAANVIAAGGKIGPISLARCLELLKQRVHVEEVATITLQVGDFANFPDWEIWIKEFIGTLNYLRVFGYSDPTPPEQREALLARSISESEERMMEIFPPFLLSPDKLVRINVARLLQQLVKTHSEFCLRLLPTLMNAFELPDNRDLESADVAVADTIAEIIISKGTPALKQFEELFKSFKIGEAVLSALRVFDLLLENEGFLKEHQELVEDLSEALPAAVIDKESSFEWRDHALESLKRLCRSGKAPQNLFTTLIGCLSQVNEERKTHKWYVQQLKDEKIATFNPLAGMNVWDIEHIEIKLNSYKDKLVGLLADWLQKDPDNTYQVFSETLKGLDEKANPEFKTDLSKAARKGLSSPRYIVKYLPQLYTQLFDKDVTIRLQALYFLDKLIEDYPQLVTDTLLGIIDAFSADPEITIRAQVLTLVGTIAQSPRFELTDQHIHYVEAAFRQKYVYIIQQAVGAARYIYQKMSMAQMEQLALDLAGMALNAGNPKHGDLEESALSLLIEISLVHTQYLPGVVQNIILPLCKIRRDKMDKKYVDVLKDIKDIHPKYSGIWIKALIEYLSVSERDKYNPSFDPRNWHYKELFDSPIKLLNRYKPELLSAAKTVAGKDPIDGLNFIFLFCFLEYYPEATTVCELIQSSIASTKSNETILQVISAIKNSIECFTMTGEPAEIRDKIYQTKNELQNLRTGAGPKPT